MNKTTKLFRPSEYLQPTDITEASQLLSKYGEKARFIAGGTDILVEKKPQIEVLIDITGLGISYIRSDNQYVRIGATTTFAAIAASPILNKSPYNILAEAARLVGTPQVRNMATIGGNICHAVPSADSAPALLAFDAALDIVGPAVKRSIDIADLFRDVRETTLDRNELLTEIRLPIFPARTEAIFIKKGRVAIGDLALLNAAIRLTMTTDFICKDVRIALGAVAPTPLRARQAEAMLEGQKPQEELLAEVAAMASEEIKPISDVRSSAEYRRLLARVSVERALRQLAARLSP